MRNRKGRPVTLPATISETVPTRKARPHTKEMVRLTARNSGVPHTSLGVDSRA